MWRSIVGAAQDRLKDLAWEHTLVTAQLPLPLGCQVAAEVQERHGGAIAFEYRLIDTAGSELGIVSDERPVISEGDSVPLPGDGRDVEVLEVYDGEDGREGGVAATLVVDVE